MLLRLLSGLFRRNSTPAPQGTPAGRGAAVAQDGVARPAVRLSDSSIDLSNVAVESHPELRSAALLHTHYLPDVSAAALFEMHARYGRMFENDVPESERELHRIEDADPRRRLRIGYVSPNFSRHSVSYLIEPVLAHHDRSAFEIYGYHTARARDATTDRIEASLDAWRQVDGLSDLALAQRIAADRVDVLVDLAGHTLGGRLGAFARRPAPVQITWLGYPDTTGVPAMDYRITDAIADPPGAEARHTERLLRVPGSFLSYRPPAAAPEVAARDDAPEVVFCSFNTLEKVNEPLIALWSRVLLAAPGSRLLLKSGLLAQPAVAQRMRAAFAAHGIEESRLELQGWTEEPARHLAMYGRADIALDTWQYNGTITTCEAMWMGVPVVTLAGEAHMSRVGATLLTALGLQELIAESPDAFVEIAAALARDRGRLHALRSTMRQRLKASMLLDHAGYTRKIEALMRQAWIERCGEA